MGEGDPAELPDVAALRAENVALRAELEARRTGAPAPAPWPSYPVPRIDSAPTFSVMPPQTLSSIAVTEKTVTEKLPTKVEDRWTKLAQVLVLAIAHYLYTHQPAPKANEVPACVPQP